MDYKIKNKTKSGNCKGVDLNRNYEANWGGPGASGNACSDTFRGPSVFSESESQAQRDYLAPMFADQSMKVYEKNLKIYLNLNSGFLDLPLIWTVYSLPIFI